MVRERGGKGVLGNAKECSRRGVMEAMEEKRLVFQGYGARSHASGGICV